MWLLLAVFLAQSVDYSAEGMKALDAQKYDTALELFTKAVAEDPKDYGARFNLALAYSLMGRDAESIPQYKTVLELKPGLYEAELNLGISLLRSKDAAAAGVQLKAAAEQKPGEFRPVFYLGEALRESGSLAGAELAYATAATLKPDSAEAEWGLAQTLLREKKLADSEPHFRKAAALNPKYKSYLLELASQLEADHQTERPSLYTVNFRTIRQRGSAWARCCSIRAMPRRRFRLSRQPPQRLQRPAIAWRWRRRI